MRLQFVFSWCEKVGGKLMLLDHISIDVTNAVRIPQNGVSLQFCLKMFGRRGQVERLGAFAEDVFGAKGLLF